MTLEDSCIIILGLPGNKQVTFKQINPELEVDEQTFKYGLFDFSGITIFKPCRPGSRWMLTKIKGEQLRTTCGLFLFIRNRHGNTFSGQG